MKPDSDEIKSLISQGAGYNLEFKESFSNSIAREICAFANASGGRLLLGVSNEGEVKGITTSNAMISGIYDIARNSDPPLKVEISRVYVVTLGHYQSIWEIPLPTFWSGYVSGLIHFLLLETILPVE